MLKNILNIQLIILFFSTLSFAQIYDKRIKTIEIEDRSKFPLKYEYIYDNNGNLTLIAKKNYVSNTWMTDLKIEIKYLKNDIIVCTYKPTITGEGALDIDKLAKMRKSKKEVDTIWLKNNKIMRVSKLRQEDDDEKEYILYTYFFKYTKDTIDEVFAVRLPIYKDDEEIKKFHDPKLSKVYDVNFYYKNGKLSSASYYKSGYKIYYNYYWENNNLIEVRRYNEKESEYYFGYDINYKDYNISEITCSLKEDNNKNQFIEKWFYEYGNNYIKKIYRNDSEIKVTKFIYEEGKSNSNIFDLVKALDYPDDLIKYTFIK